MSTALRSAHPCEQPGATARKIVRPWSLLARSLRAKRGSLTAVPSVMADFMASAVSRRRLSLVLAGVAIAVQVLLLCYFFVLGLGWGGFWYLANLGQAAAFLVLALALVRKRPLLVVPLPVVSLMLSLTFQAVDPSLKTTECTAAELSAVAELAPPPGTPAPQFQSEPVNGCIARFSTTLTSDQVLDHYRLTADNAGWEVEEAGEIVVEPGEEPPTPGMGSLDMTKNQISAALLLEPAGEEDPTGAETWVVIEVHEPK